MGSLGICSKAMWCVAIACSLGLLLLIRLFALDHYSIAQREDVGAGGAPRLASAQRLQCVVDRWRL